MQKINENSTIHFSCQNLKPSSNNKMTKLHQFSLSQVNQTTHRNLNSEDRNLYSSTKLGYNHRLCIEMEESLHLHMVLSLAPSTKQTKSRNSHLTS